jgi:hypothetical protein
LSTAPVLGAKRTFSEAEILSSIEQSRKRVKYFEEQTDKVRKLVATGYQNTEEFENVLDEYRQKRREGSELEIIP